MRILVTLPLYILRELCLAFVMSLVIYSFVFLLLFGGEVLRTGVGMFTTLEILPYIFPLISRLVLPLSIITAILISYGRFAANNEFVAAQAGGIHPFWLGVPGLVVALFASIITIYLNADVMTGAVIGMERRILADRTNIINSKLEKPGSFSFQIPGSIALAICRLPESWSNESGKTGIDFAVFRQPGFSSGADALWDTRYPYVETRTLAKDHQIKVTEDDAGDMTIVGDFFNAIIFNKLNDNLTSIQLAPHSQDKFVHPNTGFNITFDSRRVQYMGMDKLRLASDAAEKQLREFRWHEYNVYRGNLVDAAKMLKQPEPDFPTVDGLSPEEITSKLVELRAAWRELVEEKLAATPPEIAPETLEQLRKQEEGLNWWTSIERSHRRQYNGAIAEIQVKLVMSFACISFAFLGIPLAMWGRRNSTAIGYVVGLGFAFIFYMVISALFNSVRNDNMSWTVLWAPNLIILLVGAALWWRMARRPV
jgi:lipopolysaccharide export LptBFGC system permease protein LptF